MKQKAVGCRKKVKNRIAISAHLRVCRCLVLKYQYIICMKLLSIYLFPLTFNILSDTFNITFSYAS
jgi:hypothetical protein